LELKGLIKQQRKTIRALTAEVSAARAEMDAAEALAAAAPVPGEVTAEATAGSPLQARPRSVPLYPRSAGVARFMRRLLPVRPQRPPVGFGVPDTSTWQKPGGTLARVLDLLGAGGGEVCWIGAGATYSGEILQDLLKHVKRVDITEGRPGRLRELSTLAPDRIRIVDPPYRSGKQYDLIISTPSLNSIICNLQTDLPVYGLPYLKAGGCVVTYFCRLYGLRDPRMMELPDQLDDYVAGLRPHAFSPSNWSEAVPTAALAATDPVLLVDRKVGSSSYVAWLALRKR
jgi:hypothetical protein